jgi:hypothetical protein
MLALTILGPTHNGGGFRESTPGVPAADPGRTVRA